MICHGHGRFPDGMFDTSPGPESMVDTFFHVTTDRWRSMWRFSQPSSSVRGFQGSGDFCRQMNHDDRLLRMYPNPWAIPVINQNCRSFYIILHYPSPPKNGIPNNKPTLAIWKPMESQPQIWKIARCLLHLLLQRLPPWQVPAVGGAWRLASERWLHRGEVGVGMIETPGETHQISEMGMWVSMTKSGLPFLAHLSSSFLEVATPSLVFAPASWPSWGDWQTVAGWLGVSENDIKWYKNILKTIDFWGTLWPSAPRCVQNCTDTFHARIVRGLSSAADGKCSWPPTWWVHYDMVFLKIHQ